MNLLAHLKNILRLGQVASAPRREIHEVRPRLRIDYDDGSLGVSEPEFMGHACRSPNGSWVLGYVAISDGGLNRILGRSAIVLVDMEHEQVAHYSEDVERPFDGSVSDCGTFIFNDCGWGNELSAKVIAINSLGEEIHRWSYEANVFSLGISACGNYAAVQTAHAPNHDGNRLEVIDLRSKTKCFSVSPTGGWGSAFTFELNESQALRELRVEIRDLGTFGYSPSGEFLDHKQLRCALLRSGNFSAALELIRRSVPGSANEQALLASLDELDEMLKHKGLDRAGMVASAHRLRGELLERLNRVGEALGAYESALALDPKVGVKMRLKQLRARLSVG